MLSILFLISELVQTQGRVKEQEHELMKTNQNLKTKIEENENNLDKLKHDSEVQIKSVVERSEKEQKNLRNELEGKIANLENQLENSLTSSKDEIAKHNEIHEQEIEQIKQQLENEQKILQNDFEGKITNLKGAKSQLEVDLKSSKDEIAKLGKNLENRDQEIKQIKELLEDTKQSKESEDDVDQVKDELIEAKQKIIQLENEKSSLGQVKHFSSFLLISSNERGIHFFMIWIASKFLISPISSF